MIPWYFGLARIWVFSWVKISRQRREETAWTRDSSCRKCKSSIMRHGYLNSINTGITKHFENERKQNWFQIKESSNKGFEIIIYNCLEEEIPT